MQSKFKNPCCFLVLALLGMQPVNAQPPTDAASSQAERLIQEEQLRQQQLEQEREAARLRQEPLIREVPKPPAPETIPDSQCSQIRSIVLSGASLLSKALREELTGPYVNRCLNLNDINRLLASITNYYFEHGYVTSRAYIPPQDLSDGVLELVIIEGKIQSFESDTLAPLAIAAGFPAQAGDILNLRDLEQGIEQFNRLPSNRVTMQLFPGRQPGATEIRLDNQPVFGRWRMAGTLDNSGQESTGERQIGFNYSLDNPFGIVDFFSVNMQSDAESDNRGGTESASLHYDFPFGYWNFDIDVSAFDYESQVESVFNTFNTSGESRNQNLRISRLWHRNQAGKAGTRFGLRRKKNLNFIEDTLLDTSSRTLSSVSLETWYQRNITGGYWNATLGYDRGIDAFGAENDDGKQRGEPLAEFNKVRFNAGYYKTFNWLDSPVTYSATFQSQYSDDILYGTEQISIGSQYTVRGYKEKGAIGDKGTYIRQDLAVRLPPGPAWLQQNTGIWRLGLGLDTGKVRDRDPAHDKYSQLSGWSLYLRSGGGPVSVSLEFAKAFDEPDYIAVDDYDVYVTVAYHFHPEP